MSLQLQKAFLSSPYRIWFARSVRYKKDPSWLFDWVNHNTNQFDFLDLSSFQLQKHVKLEQIYFRQKTRTIVFNLNFANNQQIILKIFYLQEPYEDAPGPTLQSCDVEVAYLHLLSRLVNSHVTPHICLPMGRSILTDNALRAFMEKKVTRSVLNQLAGNRSDRYMALFAERANHATLTDLVRKDMKNMKPARLHYVLVSVIYQVVYTLAVIHLRFPSFKHNDLHTSNVLMSHVKIDKIQQVSPSDQHFVCYTEESGKNAFIDLTVCPYRSMIWDTYFASIDRADAERWKLGTVCPKRTRLGGQSSTTARIVPNQYTDIHKLLDTLEYLLKTTSLWNMLQPNLKKFFNEVVPHAYKCASAQKSIAERDKLKMHLIHHTTCRDLVSHPIFNVLREPLDGKPLEIYNAMRSIKKNPSIGTSPLL